MIASFKRPVSLKFGLERHMKGRVDGYFSKLQEYKSDAASKKSSRKFRSSAMFGGQRTRA